MNVFVTGGTGFTGAAVVNRLIDDGHRVTVLDKQPGLIADSLEERGAKIAYGSVTDRQLVAECSRGSEVVMHLAAAFREVGAADALYKSVNVDGTRIVADEAIVAGARKLVYCSTQGVHGHIEDPPGDESSGHFSVCIRGEETRRARGPLPAGLPPRTALTVRGADSAHHLYSYPSAASGVLVRAGGRVHRGISSWRHLVVF